MILPWRRAATCNIHPSPKCQWPALNWWMSLTTSKFFTCAVVQGGGSRANRLLLNSSFVSYTSYLLRTVLTTPNSQVVSSLSCSFCSCRSPFMLRPYVSAIGQISFCTTFLRLSTNTPERSFRSNTFGSTFCWWSSRNLADGVQNQSALSSI